MNDPKVLETLTQIRDILDRRLPEGDYGPEGVVEREEWWDGYRAAVGIVARALDLNVSPDSYAAPVLDAIKDLKAKPTRAVTVARAHKINGNWQDKSDGFVGWVVDSNYKGITVDWGHPFGAWFYYHGNDTIKIHEHKDSDDA